MAILSSAVNAGDDILASQYNNLRTDLLTGDITIAGIKTFSSKPICSAGITLSDDSSIAATKKLYFDGIGDSYITESSANVLQMTVGGVGYFAISHASTEVALSSCNLRIDATKKFYLDGGGNSYITELSADYMQFVVGGTGHMVIDHNNAIIATTGVDFRLDTTKKLYLDGGSNTYILESGSDIIDTYTGGNIVLKLDASQNATFYGAVTITDTLNMSSDKAFNLGGSGDYIIHASVGDQFEFWIDGTRAGYIDSSGWHNG